MEDQFIERKFDVDFEGAHHHNHHQHDSLSVRSDLPVPITVSDLDSDAEFFVTCNGKGKAQFMIWCHPCQNVISSASARLSNCGCVRERERGSNNKRLSTTVLPRQGHGEYCETETQVANISKPWISEVADMTELNKLPRVMVEMFCFFIITMLMFEVWILLTGEHFAAFLNRFN